MSGVLYPEEGEKAQARVSGGTVYRRAVRLLSEHELAQRAERDVHAALEAAHLPPLLQLLYEAGHEAELEREDLLLRAAGCFLSFAAGNLADDLVDGDCDYLDDPPRLGPSTQFLLQNAAYRAWLGSSAPSDAVCRTAELLARATGPNHVEVRTERWNAALFREVGEAIAGRQWAAYLEVLWGGTALAPRAAQVGIALGFIAHVAEDVRSGDPRWTTMPDDDKAETLATARRYTVALEQEGLRTVDHVLRASKDVLAAAA